MDWAITTQIAAEIQSFSASDAATIATLALLEAILSVDNSLVLAVLVRTLPRSQQKKALTYGIVGAFVFRFLALVFATHMMQFVVFKLIGGGYLIYLAIKHMFFFDKGMVHQPKAPTAAGFWKVVILVELTDIAFSIDSITTAVAMSQKLLIVWIGGILGIIFLRFAAGILVRILEKLPKLEDLAYQLILFIGTKLFLESFHIDIGHGIFWMMMGIIAVIGASLIYRDYHQQNPHNPSPDSLIKQLDADEISIEQILAMDHIPREVIRHLENKGHMIFKKNPEKPDFRK